MKKHILILLFGLIYAETFCQGNFPYLEDGKVWGINNCLFPADPFSTESCWLRYYKFDGDTLINSNSYKKVYSTDDCIFNTTPNYYCDKFLYYREDTANKVYYYENGMEDEILLYDFSLSIGDSIYLAELQGNPVYAFVDSIDSLLVHDEYRKRLFFDRDEDIWVEGIGSLKNALRPFAGFFITDDSWELISVNISDELIYKNEYYSTHFIRNCLVTSIETEKISNPRFVYPNPATEFIRFNMNSVSNKYYFELFNLQGRKVKEQLIENNTSVSVQNLCKGVYMYRLIDDENIYTGKIIVE
jgi:hypothetical protein